MNDPKLKNSIQMFMYVVYNHQKQRLPRESWNFKPSSRSSCETLAPWSISFNNSLFKSNSFRLYQTCQEYIALIRNEVISGPNSKIEQKSHKKVWFLGHQEWKISLCVVFAWQPVNDFSSLLSQIGPILFSFKLFRTVLSFFRTTHRIWAKKFSLWN